MINLGFQFSPRNLVIIIIWAHLFTLQFILNGNIDFSYVQLILHEHKNSSFLSYMYEQKIN